MTQPKLITKPFADDALPGYVNEIPKENPVGAPEQNASWAVGFPPITMTDIDDGGLPPNGEDMNGVLRAITEHNLFIGGGGVYEFTDEYITEVGGYSKGAVLVSDDKTALWMSIQDNNTQNFNGATKTQWRRIAFTELDSTLTSIQNALNTKADKSVTITAGDGLVGGGTLDGNRVIAVNSSVVRTDRTITAGTGLSGGGNLSANRTLSVNYGTTAGTAAQGNDSRITGAAQKAANLSDLANAPAARQNLGLGTAATRDVGTSTGNVMQVGAYGLGEQFIATLPATYLGWNALFNMNLVAINSFGPFASWLGISQNTAHIINNDGNNIILSAELIHTGNILATTGQSTLYPMSQKAVTDALNNKVDKVVAVTGSITLNGTTNNTAAMSDIVTELDLEIGDVIRIDAGAYNKLHTVESITNNSSIIVNYEHAGNRGNGSLKLPDTTAQATVTRIAKWFNAPVGVGQAWVNVTDFRSAPDNDWGATYFNTTGRTIEVSLTSFHGGSSSQAGCFIMVDDMRLAGGVGSASGDQFAVTTTVPFNSPYKFQKHTNDEYFFVRELR